MASYENAEIKLKEYFNGKLDTRIENRKLKLKYPMSKRDDQDIKITKTTNPHSAEDKTVRQIEDMELDILKYQFRATQRFVSSCDLMTQRILELRYRDNQMWKEIANRLSLEESWCRRKRTEAVEEFKDWLG